MLWFGRRSSNNYVRNWARRKYKFNIKIKTTSMQLCNRDVLHKFIYALYIPSPWIITILEKYKTKSRFFLLYAQTSTYYFKLPLFYGACKLTFDNQTSTLLLASETNPNFYSLYINNLSQLFHSFSKIIFTKLKFKGKGYYVFKNKRNTITPQFGHAHRIYIYAHRVSVKFLTKTTVFIYGLSKRDILLIGQQLKYAKPINIFTGRGVRFSRQLVYKKTGKVSSYR